MAYSENGQQNAARGWTQQVSFSSELRGTCQRQMLNHTFSSFQFVAKVNEKHTSISQI